MLKKIKSIIENNKEAIKKIKNEEEILIEGDLNSTDIENKKSESDIDKILKFNVWYKNFIESEQKDTNSSIKDDEIKNKYKKYAGEKIKDIYSEEIPGIEYFNEDIALKLLSLNQGFDSKLSLEQLNKLKDQLEYVIKETDKCNSMIKKEDVNYTLEERKVFENTNYNKEVAHFQGWFENTHNRFKDDHISQRNTHDATPSIEDLSKSKNEYKNYVEKKVKKIYSKEIPGIEHINNDGAFKLHEINQKFNRDLVDTRSNENKENKKTIQPLSLNEIKDIHNQIEEIIKEIDRCNLKYKESIQDKSQESKNLQNDTEIKETDTLKSKSKKNKQELER